MFLTKTIIMKNLMSAVFFLGFFSFISAHLRQASNSKSLPV